MKIQPRNVSHLILWCSPILEVRSTETKMGFVQLRPLHLEKLIRCLSEIFLIETADSKNAC